MSKDKILLVEDEPDLLQTLAFNFESEGYKVAKALDGKEAMKFLEDDDSISLGDLDENVNNERVDMTILPDAPEDTLETVDIFALNLAIEKYEAKFALKLSSKHLLARTVVNDIFSFCSDIHAMKLDLITTKLKEKFADSSSLKVDDIIETIDLVDNVTGLGNKLETHYKRDGILKSRFD